MPGRRRLTMVSKFADLSVCRTHLTTSTNKSSIRLSRGRLISSPTTLGLSNSSWSSVRHFTCRAAVRWEADPSSFDLEGEKASVAHSTAFAAHPVFLDT